MFNVKRDICYEKERTVFECRSTMVHFYIGRKPHEFTFVYNSKVCLHRSFNNIHTMGAVMFMLSHRIPFRIMRYINNHSSLWFCYHRLIKMATAQINPWNFIDVKDFCLSCHRKILHTSFYSHVKSATQGKESSEEPKPDINYIIFSLKPP